MLKSCVHYVNTIDVWKHVRYLIIRSKAYLYEKPEFAFVESRIHGPMADPHQMKWFLLGSSDDAYGVSLGGFIDVASRNKENEVTRKRY